MKQPWGKSRGIQEVAGRIQVPRREKAATWVAA